LSVAGSEVGDRRPRRSKRAATWLTLSNIGFNVFGLATGPLLARALGPEGRGTLAAILVPLQLAPHVLGIGLPTYALWYVAQRGRTRQVATTLAVIVAVLGVAALPLIPVAAGLLAQDRSLVYGFLVGGLCATPLFVMINVLISSAVALERVGILVATRLLGPALTLVLLIALWAADRVTVTTAALANLGSQLLVLAPAALVLGGGGAWAFKRDLVKPAMRFGIRAWPGTLGALAAARLDQLLMIPLVDERDLGLYVVAYTLSTGPAVVATAYQYTISPRVARGEQAAIAAGSRLLTPILVVFAGGLAIVTPVLLPLLFGGSFAAAVPLALILLAASVPGQLSAYLGQMMAAAGRPGLFTKSHGVAFAVTLVGLVIALPLAGVYGAAWVSLAAYTAQLAYTLRHVMRIFGGDLRHYLLPRASDLRGITRSPHSSD
jgi:O-antigen/teichoic acid export membrane protein